MNKTFLGIEFSKQPFFRLLPAVLMMLAIFLFSARPSNVLPMPLLQKIIYKGGHFVGYALLASCYWRAFGFKGKHLWIAWLLAVLYAVTDEYHQSFVPGRHPAAFDVLVYDNFGALTALWLLNKFGKQKQPDS